MSSAPPSIDAYLAALPDPSRAVMADIRQRIGALVPDSTERTAYAIPCARLNGRNFLYYAAWKHHIALYPIYPGDMDFELRVGPYRKTANTVHFLLKHPAPWPVIDAIIAHQAALALTRTP